MFLSQAELGTNYFNRSCEQMALRGNVSHRTCESPTGKVALPKIILRKEYQGSERRSHDLSGNHPAGQKFETPHVVSYKRLAPTFT
jgi:hypothetical protein